MSHQNEDQFEEPDTYDIKNKDELKIDPNAIL
jgi:hypothetical protein